MKHQEIWVDFDEKYVGSYMQLKYLGLGTYKPKKL